MEASLQSKYAHGNHDAFPTEFHKALQLYRKEYQPKTRPWHQNQDQDKNQNKESDQNGRDKSKERDDQLDSDTDEEDDDDNSDTPTGGTLGVHIEDTTKQDDKKLGPAALFLEQHKDMENVCWEDDSIDGSLSSSDDKDGVVCAMFSSLTSSIVQMMMQSKLVVSE